MSDLIYDNKRHVAMTLDRAIEVMEKQAVRIKELETKLENSEQAADCYYQLGEELEVPELGSVIEHVHAAIERTKKLEAIINSIPAVLVDTLFDIGSEHFMGKHTKRIQFMDQDDLPMGGFGEEPLKAFFGEIIKELTE